MRKSEFTVYQYSPIPSFKDSLEEDIDELEELKFTSKEKDSERLKTLRQMLLEEIKNIKTNPFS